MKRMIFSVAVRGFTLVELAIVMTIIGLLIGGILKGQELLENARVTSTVAQIKSYEAAVTAFRDIYDGLPGDLRHAGNRIPGCTGNCTPPQLTSGDGIVGHDNDGCYGTVSNSTQVPPVLASDESWLFWVHLAKANLIAGVSDIGLQDSTKRSFGVTDPVAKIGGGFWAASQVCVKQFRGVGGLSLVLDSEIRNLAMTSHGMEASLEGDPDPLGASAVSGKANMTPLRAAQIDRKIDDGLPWRGGVQSVGNDFGTCALAGLYNEQISSKDCSLLIRIQN